MTYSMPGSLTAFDPSSVADPFATLVSTGTGKDQAIIGPYTLQRRLGYGAMGEVHLAVDSRSNQPVALKVITGAGASDSDFFQRFDRECTLLSRLDHPNIAKALDHSTAHGRPYLAMEYVAGSPLADVIANGALEPRLAVRLAVQIARGLEYAHDQVGLIHRDVKPANIIVSNFGTNHEVAKIIDFGLAKDTAANAQHLTMAGMILGTPHYMSPEQIRCEERLTFATDLYALGATLFHMLTGRVPFPRSSPAETLSAHLTAPVPDLRSVRTAIHPSLSAIVQQCLAKNPSSRYPHYRAFINACADELKGMGAPLMPTDRIARPSPPSLVQPTGLISVVTAIGKRASDTALPVPPGNRETCPTVVPTPSRTWSQDQSRDSTNRYRPSSNRDLGSAPLTPINGDEPTPGKPNSGSHALREATSKRYARLRTTTSVHRRFVLQDPVVSPIPALDYQPLPRHRALTAVLVVWPWLALVASTVAVAWLVLLARV